MPAPAAARLARLARRVVRDVLDVAAEITAPRLAWTGELLWPG